MFTPPLSQEYRMLTVVLKQYTCGIVCAYVYFIYVNTFFPFPLFLVEYSIYHMLLAFILLYSSISSIVFFCFFLFFCSGLQNSHEAEEFPLTYMVEGCPVPCLYIKIGQFHFVLLHKPYLPTSSVMIVNCALNMLNLFAEILHLSHTVS